MFAEVNGISMYYEVAGSGEPVILIHGNSETHGIFDVLVNDLSETHQVFSVDSRCHGQSSRVKGRIGYDMMAEDYIAFIKALDIHKPTVYGFSDGGIIGLKIAIREPYLLERLIVSGANLNPRGLRVSSRIGMWPRAIFGNRLYQMMLREPDIKLTELASIRIPVVVLAGENDVVKESHTMEIASAIPDSTLELVPGEDHGSYIVHSEKLYPIISKYL